MKKILFIVNVDWFFISHRLPLALEAKERGYNVSIACAITDKKEYIESLGFTVYPLSLSRSGTSIIREINTLIEIYTLIKYIKPDIAHFVTIKPVLYGGIASRFVCLPKKVFSISGLGFVFIAQGLKASLLKAIVKALYSFALKGKNTHIIVQNIYDEKIIRSIINAPITLIKGSGVNLDQYIYQEENNENLKVVMASRLLKDKGVEEYLDATKLLKKKDINAIFELYGDIDPDNPASLTNIEIDKLKMEANVVIHGFSNNIKTIFANANIIVLPSYREGLPKVLIEAAACGRAVVTTDVPGCRDAIIPNETGLLCKVKSVQSLAEAIEKLLLDNALRNQMGKAGRTLAEKEFDIQNVIQKHFEIYETA